MKVRRISSTFVSALAALLAVTYLAYPQVCESGNEPLMTALPQSVIAAWDKAGAEAGWQIRSNGGSLGFRFNPFENEGCLLAFATPPFGKSDATPAFLLSWSPGVLSKVPPPSAPFGLLLSGSLLDNQGLKEISQLAQLRSLELNVNKTSFTNDGLNHLVVLPNLEVLYIALGADVTDSTTNNLAAISRLRDLSVATCDITDLGLRRLINLKHLESLNISGTRITDKGLIDLAKLKQLRALDLCQTDITDTGLKAIGALEGLQRLDISLCNGITDLGLKHLSTLAKLTAIDLTQSPITDRGVRSLVALKQLESLTLVRLPITGDGLKELEPLAHLKHLNLRMCESIEDVDLPSVARLKSIEVLDLRGTGITDAGVKELSAMRRLQSLALGDTRVTGTSLGDLAELPQLRWLS